MFRICVLSFIVFYLFHECQPTTKGIEMVPERVQVVYLNPKYITNISVSVRRRSRGGQYVVNLSGNNMQQWANNVSLSVYFYEFLHNEYRRSFVEVTYKLCDFINVDFIGKRIQQYGIVCPLYVNHWNLINATISIPSFPYVFPFTKCKLEVVLRRSVPTEELMGTGFLFVKIKEI